MGLGISIVAASAQAQLYQADPETDAPAAARMASGETTIMLDPLYLARITTADDLYSLPLDGPVAGWKLGNPEYLLSYSVARVGANGSVTSECVSPLDVRAAVEGVPATDSEGGER